MFCDQKSCVSKNKTAETRLKWQWSLHILSQQNPSQNSQFTVYMKSAISYDITSYVNHSDAQNLTEHRRTGNSWLNFTWACSHTRVCLNVLFYRLSYFRDATLQFTDLTVRAIKVYGESGYSVWSLSATEEQKERSARRYELYSKINVRTLDYLLHCSLSASNLSSL